MANENVLNEARKIITGYFKNRREELGMTQQDLADKTGMARATINRMEQGLFWLGMRQYLLICEALHLFPAIAEMEAKDEMAEELRKNWVAKPKDMTLDEAIKLKAGKHTRPDQHN